MGQIGSIQPSAAGVIFIVHDNGKLNIVIFHTFQGKFRLCNRFFTSKKEVTLPEEESNKTKEQKSSDSAMERLKALEEEEKKDSMEEDSDDKFHLVNHYVLKSDVLRSPDGNTCAIVGMDDAMRMKAYKNKSLYGIQELLIR